MKSLNKQVPLEDIIARQIHFWDNSHSRTETKAAVLPCIAFSRQPGCSDMVLARILSERLNWKIFDKEIVEFIAANNNIRKEMVEIFDEKARTEMDNMISTLMDHHALNHQSYSRYLAKTILSIGKHGGALILGRGANFILPGKLALKVRIVESLEHRIQNLMNQDHTRESAKKSLQQQKQAQEAFLKRHFGIKSLDATSFDLVLNLSTLTVEAAADILVSALCSKFKFTEETLKVAM